jgi:ribosomal protein L40E
MKLKYRHLLPLIILLLAVPLTMAQEPASALDSLYVAFWPDYDDPSVLVLMTGTLPADASFPAEVTIPIPPQAEINAVARISEEGMADTDYVVEGDTLTLTTPDPRFRVEYYAPYEEDGDSHTFDFTWNADFDVQEFTAEIQQPVNATSLTTQPAAANVDTSPSDGLTYHALPTRALPAGTPFKMSFRYDMADPGLTAGGAAQAAPNTAPSTEEATDASSGIDWLLVVAGVALLGLVIAVTWLVATRNGGKGKARRSGKSRKPRKPTPKERSALATFCHNCGAQAEKGDTFCRKCGTALKQ